ncbi:hypothetical protein [Microbacterium sp. YJN-G]|uniref:hypothetical protein n=1 Tax=Microbacterium sp. YJN-G TaxID=2763257 RepID=UPI001877A7EF|nr:hypothetical protein [Microbacterium sp. YJN-G]
MKLLAGFALGITAMIVWHIIGWPWLGWLFTRIPPATHPDCRPRFRRWQHGVLVFDSTNGG